MGYFKRSRNTKRFIIDKEVKEKHKHLNYKIRKQVKPIPVKPDLDEIMESSMNGVKTMIYKAYTDGGCDLNSRHGSWAYCITLNNKIIKEDSGFERQTTNNRMEATALIKCLETLIKDNSSASIYLDSELVVKTFNLWMHKWKKHGWSRNKHKQVEVKNLDLVMQLDSLKSQIKNKISVEWIKGHSGIFFNEHVDDLCSIQINKNKTYDSLKPMTL